MYQNLVIQRWNVHLMEFILLTGNVGSSIGGAFSFGFSENKHSMQLVDLHTF